MVAMLWVARPTKLSAGKIRSVGIPGAGHQAVCAGRQVRADIQGKQLSMNLARLPRDSGIEPAPNMPVLTGDDSPIGCLSN